MFATLIIFLLSNSFTLNTVLKQNVELFLYKLLPAVFPYIFLTNVLIESGLIYNLSFGMSKIASKLFHIPKNCCPAIIISLLMGYPNAAKYIDSLYKNNAICPKRAQMLIGFTSNASPAYILSTIGISFYSSITLGVILLTSHILSSLILGILLGIKYKNIIQQTSNISYTLNKKTKGFEIISNSIFGTLKTLGIIFCFMAIFSSISKLVCTTLNLNANVSCIIFSLAEITNGLSAVAFSTLGETTKILVTSFALSFGSLMILYQIYAVAHTCKVSFGIFLKHKALHGTLSVIITYILIKVLDFKLPTKSVFSNIQNSYFSLTKYFNMFAVTFILTCITIIFCITLNASKLKQQNITIDKKNGKSNTYSNRYEGDKV